ncbi:uncharacterized protein [Gossypium hirsutum]|uniref:DNA/RNA polymerases superfamily protein n=1 Tax=Gossypium hirsutum TaxID=3635 RepID=A0A1U8PXW9_GOSHI|nr:uncharacterized protein LOC107963041 [Gossypium hirsutum]
MVPYEALYGRKFQTPIYWTKLRENQIHGVDLIKEAEEKFNVIRDCLKAASDRQKSYTDLRRKEIKFEVDDKYRSDPSHVIAPTEVEILPDMTYSEELVKILARKTKHLRNKSIPLVKVLWHRHEVKEAT